MPWEVPARSLYKREVSRDSKVSAGEETRSEVSQRHQPSMSNGGKPLRKQITCILIVDMPPHSKYTSIA